MNRTQPKYLLQLLRALGWYWTANHYFSLITVGQDCISLHKGGGHRDQKGRKVRQLYDAKMTRHGLLHTGCTKLNGHAQ